MFYMLKFFKNDVIVIAPEANGQRCENDMSDRVMLFFHALRRIITVEHIKRKEEELMRRTRISSNLKKLD